MPSSFVHVAFACLLAVGLLGRHYDRRAVAVVIAVVLLPEVDTLLGYLMDGAHRAVLHNAVVTAAAAAVVFWDASREDSWLRGRYGDYGVRVAWVALLAHSVAHLALDWAHLSGINVLWPLHDRFFELGGEVYLSTSEGFVQTFVDVATDGETGRRRIDVGQGGTTGDTHVGSPAQPNREPDPGPTDRRFPIAVRGWQLYLVLTGAFALVARRFQTPRYPQESADGAPDARVTHGASEAEVAPGASEAEVAHGASEAVEEGR